jgi:uncharacterized protein DUF6457
MEGKDWIARFATELGLPAPDDDTVDTLLALAGMAAHSSERTAAPIACYLVGLARATPTQARALAQTIADSPDDP